MTCVTRPVLVFVAFIVMARLAAAAQTPLDHLNQAERILNAVPLDSFKKDEQKRIGELRKHFSELANLYRTNPDPFVPPAVAKPTDEKPTAKSEAMNWREKFSEVEKDVAAILGGVSSPSLPPSEPRRQLEQFRLELELFFASATLGLTGEAQSPPQSS